MDYEPTVFLPLTPEGAAPGDPVRIDGTLAGRAYATGRLTHAVVDGDLHVWAPMIDGTERLGVIHAVTDASAGAAPDAAAASVHRTVASLFAEILVTRRLYGDAIERTRRRLPMQLAVSGCAGQPTGPQLAVDRSRANVQTGCGETGSAQAAEGPATGRRRADDQRGCPSRGGGRQARTTAAEAVPTVADAASPVMDRRPTTVRGCIAVGSCRGPRTNGTWAEEGFDEGGARRWHPLGLSLQVAGFLARRHVDPEALDVEMPVPAGIVVGGWATAAFLLTSGRLPVESVYAMLIEAHLHTPIAERELVLPNPAPAQTARLAAPIPAAVFSAPGHLDAPAPYTVSQLARRARNTRNRSGTDGGR